MLAQTFDVPLAPTVRFSKAVASVGRLLRVLPMMVMSSWAVVLALKNIAPWRSR